MTTQSIAGIDEGAESSRRAKGRFGRFRLLAAGIATVLAAVLGITVSRLRSLDGIPDVGDPFDATRAMRPVEIPDDENAYVLYGEAHAQLTRLPPSLAKVDFVTLTWSKSGQAIRDYLEQNRAAMETWRQGSERSDAIYHQPGELTIDTLLPLVQHMRTLVHLGGLEGTRLEEQGAMDRAWDWYRAMLRCSRMVGRHGVLLERGGRFGTAQGSGRADRDLGRRLAGGRQDAPPCAR